MKIQSRSRKLPLQRQRASLLGHCVMGALLASGVAALQAEEPKDEAEDPAPAEAAEPLTPGQLFEGGSGTYTNWIEFSAGGFFPSGNKSSAEAGKHLSEGAFGGIEDLHYQTRVGTNNTTLTLDGRALYDLEDYQLGIELRREKLGYIRFNYEQFRTWYDGDGGYYRPGDVWYPLPGSDEALGLDRGEITFEAGLTLENKPQAVLKYTHRFREGEKGSTSWGQAHPDLMGPARGLNASFYDIDESSDLFELDVTHKIKATQLGVGVRYETGEIDNARKMTQWPGEAQERHITDREGTSYDMFSANAFTETWIKKNLFLTSGFLFTTMDSDSSGSRIYGDDYDVAYSPNAYNALGYNDLSGGSQLNEYVLNLNLMYLAKKNLTITPSIRVQKEDWDSASGAFRTTGTSTPGFVDSNSDGDALDVTERLDVTYSGFTNVVLFARGEWTQGDGNLTENGGIEQTSPIQRDTEDSRNFQKYSLGARWYPHRKVTFDLGGYYKLHSYDYDHQFDSTLNTSLNRYPAYLTMQDFETYDANTRLTLRPVRNVSLVARYEYQISTINTQPDPVSALGTAESSEMTSHIVGGNITWVPWKRLNLQSGINYVFSETETPTSDYTQAILDAQNNYWTINLNAGLVLDDKTDLNVGYFYYRADDYTDNSPVGVPLGSGAEEHGITAMVSRRLTENLRLNLKYGFTHYTDALTGGNSDYDAHLVYSSLQYRF